MFNKIIKKIFRFLCLIVPHKKTILFESGDNIFDNGFVLGKYISNLPKYKKYKIIFIGKKDKSFYNNLPKNIKYFQFKDNKKQLLCFLLYYT